MLPDCTACAPAMSELSLLVHWDMSEHDKYLNLVWWIVCCDLHLWPYGSLLLLWPFWLSLLCYACHVISVCFASYVLFQTSRSSSLFHFSICLTFEFEARLSTGSVDTSAQPQNWSECSPSMAWVACLNACARTWKTSRSNITASLSV